MKKILLLTLVLSIFSCTNKESDECTELKNSNALLSENMENYRSAWKKSFLVKMKDGKIFQEQDYWDARKFYKQLSE